MLLSVASKIFCFAGIHFVKYLNVFHCAHVQTTDAGVLVDDMERFTRFEAAVDLVTDTSCDVKVRDASRKLGRALWSLISLMKSVVSWWSLNRMKRQGCISLEKCEIGFLNPYPDRKITWIMMYQRSHKVLAQSGILGSLSATWSE